MAIIDDTTLHTLVLYTQAKPQKIAKSAQELVEAIEDGGVGFYMTDRFWNAYNEVCRSLER